METNTITKRWAVVACGALMLMNAGATIIVDFSTYGIGTIAPGVTPSDDTYLVNMINTYNSGAPAIIGSETYTLYQGSQTPNAPLPLPASFSQEFYSAGPDVNISLGNGGYSYIFAQSQGLDSVYYIGGLTGIVGFTASGVPGNNGSQNLPFALFWLAAPVPEPTTVIAGALLLLPFAASTVRTLRKKRTT